ncbi:RAD50-interacting protein 1 isoform X3 [Leptidea sinapis]|nr:RAD50-interacting protein 1 isoform X3 [Leptidea sinapis]XP_050673038.1 RAD50-interacting protein 1 isoform X3 [Leptidea sinapis]
MEVTGYESNSVLSVLTKAETFVRWLAVEKKYALSKMDEMLDNEQWIEPLGSGVCAAVGSLLWVPRGSDWFVALLKTIEERYAILPQPGHRIQFLELQLELIEEWRVRLTQIMSATVASLSAESFLTSGPHPLTAVINTAQYIRTVLLQWAHSLHYLQLYYYKRQFQQFTQQQHRDPVKSESSTSLEYDTEHGSKQSIDDTENDTTLSLEEVESRAKHLAIKEVTRRNSMVTSQFDTPASPTATTTAGEPVEEDSDEDAGVFEDAPALFYHLRQAGLTSIIQFMLIEFREELREYRNLKWHAMLIVEERALSVSSALCKPLSGLCARLVTVSETLAPATAHFLRTELALHLDDCVFKDVVLSNWFNTGGTIQLTHDIQRNIVPALASIGKRPADISSVPKLAESCTLLNLEYEDARRIRTGLKKNNPDTISTIRSKGITTITIAEALQILNQRTDLVDASSPTSVMELF